MKTTLRRIGLALLALILALVGVIVWVVNTRAGTRWAVNFASEQMGDRLTVGGVEGALAGPLTLTNLRYNPPGNGVELVLEKVELSTDVTRLLRGGLHFERVWVQGATLTLPKEANSSTPSNEQGFSFAPPIDLVVDDFALVNGTVRRADNVLLQIDRAGLAGRWTEERLALDRLDLQSPSGEVQFKGQINPGAVYTGDGKGRFSWAIGESTYAGTLTAHTVDQRWQIAAKLDSPFDLSVNGTLAQGENLAREMSLDLPVFDPRQDVLTGSAALTGLGARLKGRGTRDRATFSGEIRVNAETIQLDRREIARKGETLEITSLVARLEGAEGAVRASGQVFLGREPWALGLDLQWDEIDVPKMETGRELRTRGELHVAGGPESYQAKGKFALGPPGKLAEFELSLGGTTEQLQIKRLKVNQETGWLMARGSLALARQFSWDIAVDAESFNPGEFLAGWPGDLDLQLSSTGARMNSGARVQLKIDQLTGTLRDRPVSGRAKLAISPSRAVTGTLHLESGDSVIDVAGASEETTQVTIVLQIASLADWLPHASGQAQANVTVQGEWPALTIDGTAKSGELKYQESSVGSLKLEAHLTNPTDPEGTVRLEAKEVAAAGFNFEAIGLGASGDANAHQVSLTARGRPLGAQFALTGSFNERGWAGTVEKLQLGLGDAADLALSEPAQVRVGRNGAFQLSRSCLVDGDIWLCIEGERTADGALQGKYSADAVPLALGSALISGGWPLRLAGTVSGEGQLGQTADGEWQGRVQLRSPSAYVLVAPHLQGDVQPTDRLRVYQNLKIAAELQGDGAHATASATLMDTGNLDAEFSLSGLGEDTTPIEGRLNAKVPSLKPLAPFVPQLGQVEGQVQATARLSGTLQKPEITGQGDARQLAAKIPRLGLALKGGALRVVRDQGGSMTLTGDIESGKGKLVLDGRWTPRGELKVGIRGSEFLAADIPAARVVITPDLTFARDQDGRLDLTGRVLVPQAKINIQRLPQGRHQSISDDVVVIDRKTEEAAEEAIELNAKIQVELGEKVELAGFGLDATLEGQLTVVEAPGALTTASGEITLGGVFQGYGQDLTITHGSVIYAGTPIADPRLNITAVREIEEVTAGVRITGTAQRPQVNVFADPAMGQAEALSYLVAGKPLDAVGTDSGDADRLHSAARSLGTAAGSLLAKRIGRRLGIDEVGIEENEMLEGDVFTVGEYLSPRLYVAYGVGLFEPGDVILLRYKLSDTLDLKAVRGPEETRAGIEYQIER